MPQELNKKEQSLNTSDFNFLSNNVKGLQSSKKRLKLFQFFYYFSYFKIRLVPKASCFYKKHILRKSWKNME